jgi:hypothetical protein
LLLAGLLPLLFDFADSSDFVLLFAIFSEAVAVDAGLGDDDDGDDDDDGGVVD